MGNIFYLMGKSSSGKDSVFQELLKDNQLNLRRAVLYTTRPIRSGEQEGVTYHFTDEDTLKQLQRENKVIEVRGYETIQGMWYYFTVEDEQFADTSAQLLMIGTLESYGKMRERFGERVIPVFIHVEDKERLIRAIYRESNQQHPVYSEVCRRFLADEKDFSEDKLKEYGIDRYFENQELQQCVKDIRTFIAGKM